MSDDSVILLKDPAFLMILLAAFCKKNNGVISFTQEDLEDVSDTDALGLFRDLDDEDIFLLKTVNSEDYKDYVADTKSKPNKIAPTKYSLFDDEEEWEN
jgi:hypothetical protein